MAEKSTENPNRAAVIEAMAVLALIGICLCACAKGRSVSPTETPVLRLTALETPEHPEQTASFTMAPTILATRASTQTPTPTANATIAAAITENAATEDAWIYESVPATQSLQATQVASFQVSCKPDFTLASPNGAWLAVACPIHPFQWELGMQLVIFDRGGNKKYRIARTDIQNIPPGSPIEPGSIMPFHWSSDSQRLYFTLEDHRGDAAVVMDGRGPLYQLNIDSGLYAQVTSSMFNHYSFSPTGRRLLWIDEDASPLTISIMDLNTGKRDDIPMPDFWGGSDSLWSPDGTRVVFVTSTSYYHYSVIWADVVNRTAHDITPGSYDLFTPVSWSDNNIIEINAEKNDPVYDMYIPYILFYNVVSGEWTGGL